METTFELVYSVTSSRKFDHQAPGCDGLMIPGLLLINL